MTSERDVNHLEQAMIRDGHYYMFEANSLTLKLQPRRFSSQEGWEVIRAGPIHLAVTDENGEPIQAGLVVFDPERFEGTLIDSPDVKMWGSKMIDELKNDEWMIQPSSIDRIVAIRNKSKDQ